MLSFFVDVGDATQKRVEYYLRVVLEKVDLEENKKVNYPFRQLAEPILDVKSEPLLQRGKNMTLTTKHVSF